MDIFISYRRQDTSGYALALRREIERALPGTKVFLDVEAIDSGMRWRDVIEHRVAQCTLMLVLIGDEWFETRDGVRKIERDEDPVRFEIAAGLARTDVVVLPVLVEEARMPSAGSLPAEVRGLCEWNAHAIHDRTYDADVNDLVAGLRRMAGPTPPSGVGGEAVTSAGPSVSAPAPEADDVDVPATPSGDGGAAKLFPARITERWVEDNLSRMHREEVLELVSELIRRNWPPDYVYDVTLSGSAYKPPKQLPTRITTQWLANNVPFLSPARVDRLAKALRARGWPDEAVRTNVHANRQSGLAAGLPNRIGLAYIERFAPLMDLTEMDALADALQARGWAEADIRKYLPFAEVSSGQQRA